MAIDDFTYTQNATYVPQATTDMSGAQVEEIERQAKAQVVNVHEESARAEDSHRHLSASAGSEASSRMAGGSSAASGSNPEAKFYGDVALDALGLKVLSSAVELIDTRHMDAAASGFNFKPAAGSTKGIMGGNVRTMDEVTRDAARTPGAYGHATGGKQRSSGEDILMGANIATQSLTEQGKDALSTWAVKDAKLANVAKAKELTFTLGNNNDLAMQSTMRVRHEHNVMLGRAAQMVPGMSMNGPSYRPQDALRMARQSEEQDSWRTS